MKASLLRHRPAREIGITTRSVSGVVPSMGRYESSLERDLMEILRFDYNVELFQPQPLTLSYRNKEGCSREYTPDGLIHFHSKSIEAPVLYEVKYRADFRKEWKLHIPKYRAAKALCMDRGWRFEVFTEKEIRTPYLENVKFLWSYRDRAVSSEMKKRVLQILWDLDEADPNFLLCALCRNADNRARMIPVVWYLIATGAIGCDLDVPLTMASPIWAREDC